MHLLARNVPAILLAATCCAAASAAQPALTHADCRRIAESMERLACYDGITARDEAAAAGGAAKPAPAAAAAAETTRAKTAPEPAARTPSVMEAAWALDPASAPFQISLHDANYALLGRWSNSPNNAPFSPLFAAAGAPPQDLDNVEAKYQISFKARLWTADDRRWSLWAAYTQQSQWQVYNGDISRPFRDTNYMPELFATYRPDVDLGGGFRWRLLNAGFVHQSNGRSDILSRSWNRLVAKFGVERGNLSLYGTFWYRLPDTAGGDDNPDITKYYGHGEISTVYRRGDHDFRLALRGNAAKGKGAVQAGWFTPPLIGPLRGYVQVFSGYGESLIDYNWNQTTIGAGVALNPGF